MSAWVGLIAVLIAVVPALAEDGGGPVIERVDATGFPRIVVSFTPESFRVGTEKPSETVHVLEDKVDPGPLTPTPDRSVIRVVLVLHRSEATQAAMKELKQAVRAFARALPERAKVVMASPPKGSPGAVRDTKAAQRSAQVEHGEVRSFPELLKSALKDLTGSDRQERRVIVGFTADKIVKPEPGTMGPGVSAKDVVIESRRSGVPLYLLGLAPGANPALLIKIGALTGGRYFHVPALGQLEPRFRELAEVLKGTLQVSYTSPRSDPDGRRRALELSVGSSRNQRKAQGQYVAPTRDTVRISPAARIVSRSSPGSAASPAVDRSVGPSPAPTAAHQASGTAASPRADRGRTSIAEAAPGPARSAKNVSTPGAGVSVSDRVHRVTDRVKDFGGDDAYKAADLDANGR